MRNTGCREIGGTGADNRRGGNYAFKGAGDDQLITNTLEIPFYLKFRENGTENVLIVFQLLRLREIYWCRCTK